MSTTTDKPTVESDDVHTIRCRNVVRHGAIDDATTDNSAFGTAAMKKAADDVDALLAEVERLKAENERLQGKLTAWERSASATSGRSR